MLMSCMVDEVDTRFDTTGQSAVGTRAVEGTSTHHSATHAGVMPLAQ